jgi:toxin ParE1/3/4
MKIRWLLTALDRLAAVRAHIGEENPRAAAHVADRIEQSVARLATFPNSGRPGSVPGTREIVISGLPYLLVYRVVESEVQVLRLFHDREDRQLGRLP